MTRLEELAINKKIISHLQNLGINAIELMPVNEFDGNNSWGYNPTYHYALDKYYGSPDTFRAFVDECGRCCMHLRFLAESPCPFQSPLASSEPSLRTPR